MYVGHQEYFLCDSQICVGMSNKKGGAESAHACTLACSQFPKSSHRSLHCSSLPPGISTCHMYIEPTNTTLVHSLLAAVTHSRPSLHLMLAGISALLFGPPLVDWLAVVTFGIAQQPLLSSKRLIPEGNGGGKEGKLVKINSNGILMTPQTSGSTCT